MQHPEHATANSKLVVGNKFNCPLAFLVLFLAVLVINPMVGIGYATTYSSTTENIGNSLDTDFFVLSLYTYNDFEHDQPETVEFNSEDFTVCAGSFASGTINYTQSSGSKSIVSNNYTLSPSNLYIAGLYNGSVENWGYNLSLDFEFKDGDALLEGITGYLVNDNEVIDSETLFAPNIAYRLQFSANFPAVSFSADSITCSVILESIRVSTSDIHAVYSESETCSMALIEDSPIMDQVDVIPGEGFSGNLTKEEASVAGHPSVNIKNSTNPQGGIADSDGNVNLSISIPANTPFLVRIWNKESYNVTTHVEIGNVIINGQTGSHTYNRNLSAGFATFLCHYVDSWGSHQWYRSNLSQIIDNNGWYYSSSGTVTIEIEAHYDDGSGTKTAQNVFLDIVFKDTPTP